MKLNRTKIVTSYSMITSAYLLSQGKFVYQICNYAVAFAAAFYIYEKAGGSYFY